VTAYSTSLEPIVNRSSSSLRAICGVMAAAVAIGFFVGVGATPGSWEKPAPEPANPQVAALMSDYGVSGREATERIARQDAVADLATHLADRFPGAYGGLWIDHGHGGVVVTAVTKAGVGMHSARKFGLRAVAREIVVDRSLRDLRQLSVEIRRMVGHALSHAERRLTTSIDVTRNAVSVQMGSATSAVEGIRHRRVLQEIKRVYGPAVSITKRQSMPTYDDACVDTNCPPPLRGGVQIKGSKACSIGFVVTTSSGAPAVTTAGHCPPPASRMYAHRGGTIGSTLAMQDNGDVDARSVSIKDTAYWSPANWLLHQDFGSFPADESFVIGSRAVKTDIVLGLYLCRTGFKTGTQCGEVDNLNGRRSGNRPLFGVRACAAGGDSGGPVYDFSSGRAYGQHVASTSAQCAPGETSFFSPIDSIEAALGVTVRTD
jgi:streptogrisin C